MANAMRQDKMCICTLIILQMHTIIQGLAAPRGDNFAASP